MRCKGSMMTMLVLAVTTFDGIAQQKLIPSTTLLTTPLSKPEKQTSTWYLGQGSARRALAAITTTIRPQYQADKILIIQEIAMNGTSNTWIDSTIALQATLAPVYHSSYNEQRDMVLHFRGSQVVGYYRNKQDQLTTRVQNQLTEPCFDSNLYPHLIRFLPLRTGYQALLPIYDYSPKKQGVLLARVVAVTETVLTSQGQATPCYVVQVSDEISPDSQATYYVAKADRRLLKSELLIGGRRMSIE